MNVKGALTRKIGPLPAWGWGVAIGGALLAVKMIRGGGSIGGGSGKQTTVYVPTGNEVGSSDFASELGNEFAKFRDDVSDSLDDLRDEIADIESPQVTPPSGNQPPGSKPPATNPPSGNQPPAGSVPPTTKPPSIWTIGTRTFTVLEEARAFARRVIRDYSPGGALYGQGKAGSYTSRHTIPVIPTNVLSAAEQRQLAQQHGGVLQT